MNLKLALTSRPAPDRWSNVPFMPRSSNYRLKLDANRPVELLVRIREMRRQALRHWRQ